MSGARNHVFQQWPFAPEFYEPAHGFFLRLIWAQGETSFRNFNIWNEVDTDRIATERMMSTLEDHPMPAAWFEMLRFNTPLRDGTDYVLRGQRLPTHHIRFYPRRWCPGCIHDDAYHRAWWDVESIRRCPIHGEELGSSDLDGNPVTWLWTDFAFSREGVDMGRHCEAVADAAPFANYLLGRLGWSLTTSAALLDPLPVRDVIDYCEFVGRFLENGPSRKHPAIGIDSADVGFRALAASKSDLAESFRVWLREHRRGSYAKGASSAFSWAYPKLDFMPDGDLKNVIRRAMHEALVFEKEGRAARIVDEDFDIEFTPKTEIARALNIEPRAVRIIANAAGVLHPLRHRKTVEANAVDRIAEYKETLVTIGEAAERLGIHQDAIRHLVHAGHLTVFKGLNPGQRAGGRYSPVEIDAVLELIDKLPVTGSPAYGLTLHTYRMRNQLVPGEVAVACLKRELVICEKRDDVPGFKRLMVQTDAKRKRQAFNRSDDTMTMAEAHTLLNVTYETVFTLVERGVFGEVDRSPKQVLIDRAVVEKFAAEYAKSSDYATAVGWTGQMLTGRLIKAGIEPIVKFVKTGKFVDTVFKRKDMMAFLKLEDDPTLVDDERVLRFWSIIVPEAAKTCPYMLFPPRLPPGGQRVWNSNRGLSAHFLFKREPGEIHVKLNARGEKHEFRFDLNTDEYFTAIKEMLDVFNRMVKQATERQNAKTREWWAKRKKAD